MNDMAIRCRPIHTPHSLFPLVRIFWSPGPAHIVRIHLVEPPDNAAPDTPEDSCGEIEAVAAHVAAFLGGRPQTFDADQALCRLDLCPPFHQRVLEATAQISRGRVCTYGAIARALGQPGAGRAVGNALARNPFPLVVPCHRVVRADGALGGFLKECETGPELKRALLEMEGVGFDARGKVAPEHLDG